MPVCLGLKLCCDLLHSQSKLPEIRQAWIKARLCSEVWCSGDVCELDLFKEQEQTKEVSFQLHFYSLSHWRKKKNAFRHKAARIVALPPGHGSPP